MRSLKLGSQKQKRLEDLGPQAALGTNEQGLCVGC